MSKRWPNSWSSITTVAGKLATDYKARGSQLRALGETLDALQVFADSMRDAFTLCFAANKLKVDDHPSEEVYSIILSQASNDLEVIQRAAEFRLTAISPLSECLNEADSRAQDIINAAVDVELLPSGTRAITYFQKMPSIRVTPYAGIALIGIPYTCVDEPRDLLAIAHEVGHYVYWHAYQIDKATDNRRYLCDQLMNQAVKRLAALATPRRPKFDGWCYAWLEEVFADVFGCWMAGPLCGLTVQDLAKTSSNQEFKSSDGEHPVPVIRPYLHIKTLGARGVSAWTDCANLLIDSWDASARRHITSFSAAGESAINVDAALVKGISLDITRPVDCLIDVVLSQLKASKLPAGDWRHPVAASPADISGLCQQYDDFRVSPSVVANTVSQPHTSNLWTETFQDWVSSRYGWLPNDPNGLPPELKTLLLDPGNATAVSAAIDEGDWWQVVSARGWTTGPQDRWP